MKNKISVFPKKKKIKKNFEKNFFEKMKIILWYIFFIIKNLIYN